MSDKTVGTESPQPLDSGKAAAKKLRLAFTGCGFVMGFHMNALKHFSDVEVVAGADTHAGRLADFGKKWSVPQLFSSSRQMLRKVKPDVVSVCTPNGLHLQHTLEALEAGCDVIVEKPMAMSPQQCQKMIDAAKRNGRKLIIGFQFRYHPKTQFLIRARDEGQFGDIMFVKCQALRRRGIPNWGVFGQKKLQGGGPMIDIGVHILEMAHYVMGSPRPIAASGNTWTYHGNKPSKVISRWPNWDHKTYTVEDLAIGQIRFANGALLQIEASFVAHIEHDTWKWSLMGTKGGAQWDPPMIFTDRAGTMTNTAPGYLPEADFPELFVAKLRNFADHILYDKPTEAPGEAGLMVQKMLDGIYRSAAAGKEVSID